MTNSERVSQRILTTGNRISKVGFITGGVSWGIEQLLPQDAEVARLAFSFLQQSSFIAAFLGLLAGGTAGGFEIYNHIKTKRSSS